MILFPKTGHREINLKLTGDLHSFWPAYMEPGCAIQAAVKETHKEFYTALEFMIQPQPAKQYVTVE